MFSPSCWLRPAGIPGLLPAPDNGVANTVRDLVFRPLLPTWQETYAFDITTAATSEESVASRLIHGPFIIKEISFRSGSAGGASQLLKLSVADLQTPITTLLDSVAGVPAQLSSDSARTVASFYATTVFERHVLDQTFHQGTARLIWTLNNTTGGTVTVVGHVTICHCAYLNPPHRTEEY